MSYGACIHTPRDSRLVLEDGLALQRDPVARGGAFGCCEWDEQLEFLDERAARIRPKLCQLVF